VCVCVGTSDLANVLIMWVGYGVITVIQPNATSDFGAENRDSGMLLFVCWNR
jgi:hypothetical protein